MKFVERAELRSLLQQPEGCVGVTDVRAIGEPRSLLREVVGAHVFLLDLVGDSLRLTHSTPGAGTWVATLPVGDLADRHELTLTLAWSPDELRLSAVDPKDRTRGRIAIGERKSERVQRDRDGGLIWVGQAAQGVSLRVAGELVSSPPAIELWQLTREAVRTLLTGTSPEGFIYEVVTCNAALGMLVTGLETYCQERFVEIEGEGIALDVLAFLKRFGTKEERSEIKAGRRPEAAGGADDLALDRASDVVGRVNFQNFDALKAALAKGYGLRLGLDLKLTNQALERVQTLLRYRHRIVHVSPTITILNQGPETPEEDWEWSTKDLAEAASYELDQFILALHRATLALRPASQTP